MGRFGTRDLKEGVDLDVAAKPRSIPFVLKLVLAAALLYAVFNVVPFLRVLESISGADLRFLLAGLGISLISIWLSAARLRFLVEVAGERLPLSSIVKINLSAGWYGLALPGTLAGGVVRWHRLTRLGAGKVATLAAITYARLGTGTVCTSAAWGLAPIDLRPRARLLSRPRGRPAFRRARRDERSASAVACVRRKEAIRCGDASLSSYSPATVSLLARAVARTPDPLPASRSRVHLR